MISLRSSQMKRLGFPDLLHSGQSMQRLLAGAAGTHCLCMYNTAKCQTMLHMVQSHVLELHVHVTIYHTCLAKSMCNPPALSCYLGECLICPDTHLLKEEPLHH